MSLMYSDCLPRLLGIVAYMMLLTLTILYLHVLLSAGKVTNIPGGMVTDQFGMVGLLTFIRAAETDHNLVSLALGSDLTTLGLNLNSPENLYPNFAGPWAETPCRPQDIDYHVPQEYLTNQQIRLVFYMWYFKCYLMPRVQKM